MTDYTLSTDEIKQIAAVLAQLEPGFLPLEIFLQIARLTVLSIIEFVPLRLNAQGKVEVLLLPRASDDPHWPGQLHTPGVVLRPTDTDPAFNQAFQRLREQELQGTIISEPQFVESRLHKSERGMEHARIYWVEVSGEPAQGTFFVVSQLPGELVRSQTDFIAVASQSFLQTK